MATTEGLETLAQRLVRLCKERGLTQAQMAERLGVSQLVVSDHERGGLRLQGELILKVAEILDVTADQLLGIETKGPPRNAARNLNWKSKWPPSRHCRAKNNSSSWQSSSLHYPTRGTVRVSGSDSLSPFRYL